MNLHEQSVVVGDKVYDLLEQWGTVTRVDDFSNLITVKFNGRQFYSYNEAGVRKGNTPSRFPAMLYWQDPIVMIPVKGDAKWEAMKGLFLEAYQVLKRV